jgi:hypothetical protein
VQCTVQATAPVAVKEQTTSPAHAAHTIRYVLQVIKEVDAAEAAGAIGEWSQEGQPERIFEAEPPRGAIAAEAWLPALGATELALENGMRVTYRPSDLMDDQIVMSVRGAALACCLRAPRVLLAVLERCA